MSDRSRESADRMAPVYECVNFLATFGTLTLLAGVCLWLVMSASEAGAFAGIRSLAAVLFPAVIASFIYLFNREILDGLGRVPSGAAFGAAAVAGVAVMLVLRFFVKEFTIPIAELVTSGCFSVLVFSSRALPEKHALSYYYGALSGILLYVVVFGFPLLQ